MYMNKKRIVLFVMNKKRIVLFVIIAYIVLSLISTGRNKQRYTATYVRNNTVTYEQARSEYHKEYLVLESKIESEFIEYNQLFTEVEELVISSSFDLLSVGHGSDGQAFSIIHATLADGRSFTTEEFIDKYSQLSDSLEKLLSVTDISGCLFTEGFIYFTYPTYYGEGEYALSRWYLTVCVTKETNIFYMYDLAYKSVEIYPGWYIVPKIGPFPRRLRFTNDNWYQYQY